MKVSLDHPLGGPWGAQKSMVSGWESPFSFSSSQLGIVWPRGISPSLWYSPIHRDCRMCPRKGTPNKCDSIAIDRHGTSPRGCEYPPVLELHVPWASQLRTDSLVSQTHLE